MELFYVFEGILFLYYIYDFSSGRSYGGFELR